MFKTFSCITFETLNEFKFCVPFNLRRFKGKGRRGDGGHVLSAQLLSRVGS